LYSSFSGDKVILIFDTIFKREFQSLLSRPIPLWLPISWNFLFIVVNAAWIGKLVHDDKKAEDRRGEVID